MKPTDKNLEQTKPSMIKHGQHSAQTREKFKPCLYPGLSIENLLQIPIIFQLTSWGRAEPSSSMIKAKNYDKPCLLLLKIHNFLNRFNTKRFHSQNKFLFKISKSELQVRKSGLMLCQNNILPKQCSSPKKSFGSQT